MKKTYLFLNDCFLPSCESLIESLAPVHLRGQGVFETIRVFQGKGLFLEDHLMRLFASLKQLKIRPPYKGAKIKSLIRQIIKKNKLKNARLRLTVWKVKGKVHISILSWSVGPYKRGDYSKGFKVDFVREKVNQRAKYVNLKSIDYGYYQKAYVKAQDSKFDEAIVLNRRGELVEGTRTNLFFIKDRVLYTPHLKSGALKGVTRGRVLKIAKDAKVKTVVTLSKPATLRSCDEAFLTNSLMGVMPVTKIGRKRLGLGIMGPVTKEIFDRYQKRLKKA